VVPYLKNLTLDAEDSVGFGQRERPTWPQQQTATRRLQIGVVAFPSISNFTDFDALDAEPSVALKYFHDPIGIEAADVIILPGSKQTVDDLRWMQERAFDRAVLRHAEKGGLIAGICGGFQMLGEEIVDSHGVERAGIEQGLGLLSVRTIMAQDKVTVTQCGALNKQLLFGQPIDAIDVNGYEIHLGTTEYLDGAVPFASLLMCGDETPAHSDGCISPDQRIFGTYLHGIFDADTFRHSFLRASRAALQMPAPRQLIAWSEKRRQQLDLLADAFGKALDLNAIFGMVGLSFPPNREDRTL
jgi:adenosylcobyric acid synthase